MKIEGRNAAREFLNAKEKSDKVLIDESQKDEGIKKLAAAFKGAGHNVRYVAKAALDAESNSGRHQGIIVIASDYEYCQVDDIVASDKDKLVIILDGIVDPHNFGSIIRVAECAGADGIIIAKDRQAQVNDTVMRVSEGACSRVKIARVTNIAVTIDNLKNKGFWVYGAELNGENIYKSNLLGNIAIIIGSEGEGIRRLVKEKCDGVLTIPMQGSINSLNASVACGVVVFEALRQRSYK